MPLPCNLQKNISGLGAQFINYPATLALFRYSAKKQFSCSQVVFHWEYVATSTGTSPWWGRSCEGTMRCLRNSRTGTGTRILSASDANVRVTAWLESTLGPAVGLLNLHDTWVIDLPRLFIFIRRWKILWIFFCWVWEAFTNFKIATNHVLIPIGLQWFYSQDLIQQIVFKNALLGALPSFHERIPLVCTYLGLAQASHSTLCACSGICGTNNPNCYLIDIIWSN